jgi:flagellar motor switch/type III secretory pathway protein FliN
MSSSQISSSSSEATPTSEHLSPMLDVKCAVDFVLGSGSLKVRDCLQLERNSIVPLSQAAGADLEVRVHGITIATGEVVIVDDSTALRISKVTPPAGLEAA